MSWEEIEEVKLVLDMRDKDENPLDVKMTTFGSLSPSAYWWWCFWSSKAIGHC